MNEGATSIANKSRMGLVTHCSFPIFKAPLYCTAYSYSSSLSYVPILLKSGMIMGVALAMKCELM